MSYEDEDIPVKSMKAFRAGTGIDAVVPNLHTRWRLKIRFIPQPVHLREYKPRGHFSKMLGRPHLTKDVENLVQRYYICRTPMVHTKQTHLVSRSPLTARTTANALLMSNTRNTRVSKSFAAEFLKKLQIVPGPKI
jgi:hypothetical protein